MASLGRASGAERVDVKISDPTQVEALAFQAGGKAVLWLANLTAHPVKIALSGVSDKRTRFWTHRVLRKRPPIPMPSTRCASRLPEARSRSTPMPWRGSIDIAPPDQFPRRSP